MASVTLEHVKKIYDNHYEESVHDFDLEIKDKEFIVLIGPSGCGKSTTLRMIAGLETVSDGIIKIGDRIVNDLEPKERDVAMVFQNYALYPNITVYDNLAYPLKMRKMGNNEIHKRVTRVADILGISAALGRIPKELSGGEKQRVAIGRVIVREPAVFLMDEPLCNLDVTLRNRMRIELMELHKRIDTTFIYVTHDQTEAMTLGDRIVVMNDGNIMQVGTPQEVFDTPHNLFTAGFLGYPKMNFLRANLINDEGSYTVSLQGIKIQLSDEQCLALIDNNVKTQEIILGIRPEHVTALFEKQENSIECLIRLNEMMGSELHLHLTAKNSENIIVRLPTIDLTKEQRAQLSYGNKVHITFHPNALHLFDPTTEKNLIYGNEEK